MYNFNQFVGHARNSLLIAATGLALCACSIVGSDKIDLTANNGNVHDAIEAGTGPLQDLNIRRQEIPDLLKKAAANPYAHNEHVRCVDIATEVDQLDTILGPDFASVKIDDGSGSMVEKIQANVTGMDDVEIPTREKVYDTAVASGGHAIHDAVMDFIHDKTNIMPFRSIVRRVSGATRHQKQIEQAYQAGKLRRAYLKGLADMHFGPKCLAKPIIIETDAGATTKTASVETSAVSITK